MNTMGLLWWLCALTDHEMSVKAGVQDRDVSILAEGALRNLHLDCVLDQADGGTFNSRMLHYADERLWIADLTHVGRVTKNAEGRTLVCSCRLGRDILRFSGVIVSRAGFQLNARHRVAALVLKDLTPPQVVQRRRYFRISLAGHASADVTIWVVDPFDEAGAVQGETCGRMVDLSGGGVGVLVADASVLADSQDKQLWARFALPGENESLLFRVALRHVRPLADRRAHHVGIEFIEYVDPGRHQRVVDDLVRFVSRQERLQLRRRKDR